MKRTEIDLYFNCLTCLNCYGDLGHKKELEEIKEQLDDIEIQIEALLQTQSDLAARKEQLESLIQTSSVNTAPQSQDNSQKWDSEGSNSDRVYNIGSVLPRLLT